MSDSRNTPDCLRGILYVADGQNICRFWFVLIVFLLIADQAMGQDRLRIAWSGSSPAHTPIWVVEEKGLLKKHGIDGEIISIAASSTAVQVLLSGEVDVIIGSVTNLVSRLAGGDTVMIMGLIPT